MNQQRKLGAMTTKTERKSGECDILKVKGKKKYFKGEE